MVSASYDKETVAIRGKMIPKALYGCETSPINETAMRMLRTAFANCITFVTTRRSIDLTFVMASIGTDLDPDVDVMTRRMTMLRRMMAKDPRTAEIMKDIYAKYREGNEPGCKADEETLRSKELGRHPTSKTRARLRKQCNPKGPVGLALESAHLQAASLDENFPIKQYGQAETQTMTAFST